MTDLSLQSPAFFFPLLLVLLLLLIRFCFMTEMEEEEEGLDETIRRVPGMECFLRRRDLPSFCRNAKSTSDLALQFVTNANANVRRGRGLILNTLESLEGPVLSHIRSAIPISYALGPVHLLSRAFGDCGADVPLSSNSASLWQEDRSCLQWLDSQP